jgi:hypothetical protein
VCVSLCLEHSKDEGGYNSNELKEWVVKIFNECLSQEINNKEIIISSTTFKSKEPNLIEKFEVIGWQNKLMEKLGQTDFQ